jgi:hypothetical protein
MNVPIELAGLSMEFEICVDTAAPS